MVRARLGVLVVLGVIAALALGACVRRGGSATVGRRQQRQLVQQAARELGCDQGTLVLTALNDRVYQVHGCGQLRDYAWALGRRGGWSPLQPVVLRAAAELGCPASQLRVDAPAATVRNASGCGRSARYDLVCGGIECAWMMTAQGAGWGPQVAAAPAQPMPDAVPPPPGAVTGTPAVEPTATATTTSVDDGLVIPEPPARGSAEEMLRAALDARRADIHRCAGVGVIPVRVSWAADGSVSLALEAPLAGSAAESCVRAAVVTPRVPAGTAGEIVHPVL
ncbi:hypothetical protein [Sandaracinus amylolyticus]|uniref:hypothetical protein n=1 Tax=Sandaracinus amylolyticus TaxID=927083 RepID=UPI001F41920A|nr:hypothetical protein [Sandaracinus amylolyticus]UJR78861.1 Hypothetical protein I5071_8940 [Sandaracinus amylolyticus]